MIDIIDLSKIKCTKFLEGDFVDFKPGKIQPATDDIDALLDAICYYIFGKFQIAKIILTFQAYEGISAMELCSRGDKHQDQPIMELLVEGNEGSYQRK